MRRSVVITKAATPTAVDPGAPELAGVSAALSAGSVAVSGAAWNLPATISVQQDGVVGLRQYVLNAGAHTISVSGLPAGVTYNPVSESLEGAATGTGSATATFTLTRVGGSDVVDTATVTLVELGDWQLAAGHWEPEVFPMQVVCPREARTSVSPFNWAYPGILYERPIGVAGGAFPYKYELLSAPAGMTIGETLDFNASTGVWERDRLSNYGVVSYAVPSGSGNFSYTVRVTDQAGATVDIPVTVTVSTDRFVFVDSASGSSANPGTISQPLSSFADVWKGDVNDTTYQDKIIVFRGGSYYLVGDAVNNNGNVSIQSGKPKVYMAYPGESPAFDCSTAKIVTNGEMTDGGFLGLHFQNARSDLANSHFVWDTGSSSGMLYWRNKFENITAGTVGNDNPACIFMSDSYRERIALISNLFDDLRSGVAGGWDSYNVHYSLFENNLGTRITGDHFAFCKGVHSYCSIRQNVCTDTGTVTNGLTPFGNGNNSWFNVEWCYNKVRASTAWIEVNFGGTSETPTHHFYRNTGLGRCRILDKDTSTIYMVKNAADEIDLGVSNPSDNLVTAEIDNDCNLTGSARATYLGTRGAEIA